MTGPMFERDSGHEQLAFFQHPTTGLKAIIAVYSTALGPAIGGVRFHPYPTEAAAIEDVLRLSKAMAYKNSLAGLDAGGGKAVIIGDPATQKTSALLEQFGRCLETLGGRYRTACDVGTTVSDMDIIAQQSSHVLGRSPAHAGSGDPSGLTSYGVYQGMLACAEHAWGSPSVAGRHIGISGVGKVGRLLVDHLLANGAMVTVTDVRQDAIDYIRRAHPDVDVAPDTDTLIGSDIDVYAPCALGGALNDTSIGKLKARIVCGAANNQLAHDDNGKQLQDRGILYAPDYMVNAGGVIQVADELTGFNFERARLRVGKIYDTTKATLELAADESIPTATAADHLAEQRITEAIHRNELAA